MSSLVDDDRAPLQELEVGAKVMFLGGTILCGILCHGTSS